jgi:NAD(P)H-quinone oxidoreductase subunit 5
VAGGLGAWAFWLVSGVATGPIDASWIMPGLAFLAAAQLAGGEVGAAPNWSRLAAVPLLGLGTGGLYGLSVRLVEAALAPLHLAGAQPLDAFHVAGFAVIVLAWLALNLDLGARLQALPAWKRLYVAALNASQPDPRTVTATRTAYPL